MKRVFSVAVILAIILSQLSVIASATFSKTDCKTLDDFISDFVELTENDALPFIEDEADLLYSNNGEKVVESEQTEAKEQTQYTNRLIVKSDTVLNPLDAVDYVSGYNDLHILQFETRESTLNAIEYYSSLDCVEYVEEDVYLHEAVVDDGNDVIFETAVEYPTAVQSGSFGYITAKAESDGLDVDIAVIDSGVEINHDFLAGRVVDSGIDTISNSGTANDDRGHGTHVAGIIVSNTLENVTVYAYKALNASGSGTAAQISLAIDAAIEDEVDIINLSMSMRGTSATLKNAVQKAYNAGICVIVAAGNNGTDITNVSYSPASFDECITVMSCSNGKKILDTSNYGSPCDFAAPGENVLSTYIGNCYKLSTGTSMAAPFICAAAAYLLAKNDTLTPEEIRTALGQSVEDCVDTPTGKCVIPSTKIQIDDFAPTPQFITSSGKFVGSMYVEIADSDDADVYYYFYNSSTTYMLYKEPILITETTKISAFTVQAGKINSNIKTVTFTKMDYENDTDFEIVGNTLVAYNGTQASVTVPIAFYGKTIYTIGPNAFKDNKNITDITLGTSLNEIGESAFAGCENLLSISAPGVKYIRATAFENCTKLNTVSFSNAEYIGESAFANTTALKTVGIPLLKTIEANAFNSSGISSITISNVETIGDYAFANCTNLQSIIVGATQIGEGAFFGCSNMNYASAMNLEVIPSYCFKQCTSLNSYNFPLVIVVEASAFEGCTSLQSIDLPALVTVKERAFATTGLTAIESDSIMEISPDSFSDCLNVTNISLSSMENVNLNYFLTLNKVTTLILSNAKEIIFPVRGISVIFPKLTTFKGENIVSLPDNFLSECKILHTVSLPNVTSIGAYAFYNCDNLRSLSLPKATSIGEYAFAFTDNLVLLSLPSAKSIGAYAFQNCVGLARDLSNCTFYAEEIGVGAFDGCRLTPLNLVNLKELNCDIFGSSVAIITSLSMPSLESISNFSLSSFSKLESLNIDSYKDINNNTFVGCSKLKTLSVNSLEDFSSLSFSTIPNLEKLSAASLKEIPEKAFYNNTILKSLTLGSVTKIGASAFEGCSTLSYVNNGATPVELAEKAFYGCRSFSVKDIYSDGVIYTFGSLKIKTLGSYALRGTKSGWSSAVFEELVSVDENGFADIYCQTAVFEKVEVMHDVPENGKVLIGSKISEFSVDAVNTSTIYSPAGTVASDYCIANGVSYVEFNEKNAIAGNTPSISNSYTSWYYFRVIGFNLTYDWYGCNEKDCSDAVLVDSGSYSFKPSYSDDSGIQYKYYYCIAKSTENGNQVIIKSNVIRDAFTCVVSQSPDISIDQSNSYIYSYSANGAEMISGTYIDAENCVVTPNNSYSNVDFYGTGSKVAVVDDGAKVLKEFTFILVGDVNGDGFIDALDCTDIGLASNERATFDNNNNHLAAEMLDGADGISVSDYQAAVNKALI